MGTTFEQSPADVLRSIKIDNDAENPIETIGINRGFKRHIQEDGAMETNSTSNGTNTGMEIRENDYAKMRRYVPPQWIIDQPAVQEEVEILATQESSTANALALPSTQSARTKEQQAQLPKPLKESLKHLKNLLKLPKARRWVYCEFFYSDIDRELLLSENEFRQCLRESFPNLKTRLLRRAEWREVRRLIGRPRRCSQAFFQSERMALEARRSRIRAVHRGETLTMSEDEIDIPLKIPKPLVVGAKAFARVRSPKDGIYSGTVDAVMDGLYRVIFEKDTLAPMILPDYEVMAETPDELVAVSFLLENNRATQPVPPYRHNNNNIFPAVSKIEISPAKGVPLTGNDPILTSASYPPPPATSMGPSSSAVVQAPHPTRMAREERCGNYPLRLVIMLVKLAKIIDRKRVLIHQVQEMNREAERMHLYTEGYVRKFQEKYAKILVELERVNKTLEEFLMGISEYVGTLLPHLTEVTVTSRPEALHKFCQMHAAQIVKNANSSARNRRSIQLVTQLTALLLQVRALGQQHCNGFELHSLQRSIDEIKLSLDSGSRGEFEDNVEVHVKQIQFTMQSGESASLSSGFMDY